MQMNFLETKLKYCKQKILKNLLSIRNCIFNFRLLSLNNKSKRKVMVFVWVWNKISFWNNISFGCGIRQIIWLNCLLRTLTFTNRHVCIIIKNYFKIQQKNLQKDMLENQRSQLEVKKKKTLRYNLVLHQKLIHKIILRRLLQNPMIKKMIPLCRTSVL